MKRTALKRSKPPRRKRTVVTPLKKVKAELWKECRRIAWARAGGTCEWCGIRVVPERVPEVCGDVHHMCLLGASQRLKYRPENLALICGRCHYRFHNRESQTGWALFEKQRPADYAFIEVEKHNTGTMYAHDFRDLLEELKAWPL